VQVQYALVVVQVVTAATFLVSGVSKVLRPDEFSAALRLSHVPAPVARGAAGMPLVELALSLLLVLVAGSALAIAFGAALALLVAFTGWMAWILVRGLNVRCGCFGSSGSEVGWKTLLRNGLLIALAAAGLALALGSETALPSFSVWTLATVSAIELVGAVVVALVRAWPVLVLTMARLSESTGEQGAH
jgi:methylamine utilization protein MauE